MDDHEKMFLAGLKENEDDEMLRLVFADWLEDQGRYEECQRQRSWTAAKKWIMSILNEYGGIGWYDYEQPNGYEYREKIDFNDFCQQVQKAVEESLSSSNDRYGFYMSCGANQSLQDKLNSNRKEFFEYLAIVTGLAIPENFEEDAYFSCSC